MSYVVAQPAISQTFALDGTNSKAFLTSISSLCGPIEYSIVEGYLFATLDAVNGKISVQTNLISDTNIHSATFRAKLKNYLNVANVDIGFQITITNPCSTTTLTLPTTLTAVTITSLSGVSSSQTFAPAIDTAATSAVRDLCGNRIYSIVETLP
jgi:hypothetical protein